MARAFAYLLALAFIASLTIASLTSTAIAGGGPAKLSKADRQLVAAAAANNGRVTLLFATLESATASVANELRAMGATVRKQDVDVGYIRAEVPTDKVDAAARITGVQAVEADQVFDLILPDAGDGDLPQQLPPDSTTPAQNAYMPTRDTGAPQFVAAHPTWDGRGITIGHLDTGVDIGHPALQTTTTGERKIVDWLSYTDPVTDGDPSWIAMDRSVTVTGGSFTIDGKTYTGAPNGTWRFGSFSENNPTWANLGGSAAPEYRIACGGDLNRNGVCGETFALLWDGTQNGYVWHDSDADGSFADEVGMREYKKDFAVGEYGHDDAATAIRESVPFVTQIDAAAGYVSLGIVSGAHATHVMSIMSGGTLFGSATGAAPGAKEVSIRVCLFTSGCTAHALVEGMIYAVKDAHVNVVNMSIGGLPSLNDGNNARAILYDRLIDKWGAQLFISAGNSGPGVNTIGDPSVATKVMSVGAYWTQSSAFANYGTTTVSAEALHDFSSRGPREDGGFKPDVVAPGNATGAVPTWQDGQCLSTPNCGPGYGMFNGTSMAAPQAAGAAALLLSAAVQTGHGHKPAQLRQAMRSSARFLTNYQAHEQGFGLINVGAAWALLEQEVKTAAVSSAVATTTVLSPFLATPGVGSGIYDREGIRPGGPSYIRTYTFTRSDGGNSSFDLGWVGNDGTFAVPAGVTKLTFDKNSTATLAVTVTPGSAGVHSAILTLDDPKTAGIDYQTMNTVIVSNQLSGPSYAATVSGTANRFEAAQPKIFFQVPQGTTALRLTLANSSGSRLTGTALHPYGVPFANFFGAAFSTGGSSTITIANPLAGAWEVAVRASRTSPNAVSSFSVTATAYRVSFDPAAFTNAHTTVGTPYSTTFTATNNFAAGDIGTVGTAFASAIRASGTIAEGAMPQAYTLSVLSGSTSLTVSIGGASDPQADLDLYLYFCATPATCVLRGSGTTGSANESVTIANPTGGTWKAVVDPYSVPAGSTTYSYTDSFANAAFGTLSATTAVAPRSAGGTWPVVASGTASAAPEAGRFLRGSILAKLDSVTTGPTIGSAAFDLLDVR